MTSQQKSQVTNEILQGNIVKLMFKLSIPSTLGILMFSLNNFLDTLFAGQFIGATALAGITLSLPLVGIIEGFSLLVGFGSGSVLSRAIGSGDTTTQSKIFGNLVVMGVALSLIITGIGYKFSEELIIFMGGSGEVASAGTEYFKTYILGSIFLILGGASSQIIKSEGNLRLSTIFDLAFVIVNICLNCIFISIFKWGIHGIALATVIAMGVNTICNLTYFLTGKSSIPVNIKDFVLARKLLPAILSVGISALLFPITELVQSSVIFQSIALYGTHHDLAFFGATTRVTSLVFIPISGFAQALQPLIGINYGANNYQRIKKSYLIFATCATSLLILLLIPLQLSPETFLSIILPDINFTQDDVFYFRIYSILAPIWPLAIFGNTLFQSIGKGKTVLVVILIRTLVLTMPLVIVTSKILGLKGVYYGLITADILFMLIVMILIFIELNNLTAKRMSENF